MEGSRNSESFPSVDPAGGAGFGPPGNDPSYPDPLAGDVALNDLNSFNIDPGNEGDPLQTGTGGLYLNDVEGLVLHEIGHTLGIGHSTVIDSVLCGYVSIDFAVRPHKKTEFSRECGGRSIPETSGVAFAAAKPSTVLNNAGCARS